MKIGDEQSAEPFGDEGSTGPDASGRPADPLPDGRRPRPAGVSPPPLADPSGPLDKSVPFSGVGFTLSSLGYGVARRFRKTLAPLELEPREFALLRAVSFAEGQSQQTIGERLQIPPSRMVAFVDALEKRSLLERRQNLPIVGGVLSEQTVGVLDGRVGGSDLSGVNGTG